MIDFDDKIGLGGNLRGYEAIFVFENFLQDKHRITDETPIRVFDGDDYRDDYSGKDIDDIMHDVLVNIAIYLVIVGELSDYLFIQNGDFINIATAEFCRVKSLENNHKIGTPFLAFLKRNLSLSDVLREF